MGRIIVATTAVHQMRDLRAALEYEGHVVTEASSAQRGDRENSLGFS